jgi:cysteine-rich repeat protein
MSLFMVHGIDFETTGVRQPTATVNFTISGVPSGGSIPLSDDAGEFRATGSTSYRGTWWFRDNTDGGIIRTIPLPGDYTIRVRPDFMMGLTTWRWVNSSSFFTGLDMSQDVLIRAYPTPSMCRTDCTVPACGDGTLDGGESCDDGNTRGGDGCAADCSSVTG